MSNINKLLIVGEKFTGKSSIINIFNKYEQRNDSVNDSTATTVNNNKKLNENTDTPLKGEMTNLVTSDNSSILNSISV